MTGEAASRTVVGVFENIVEIGDGVSIEIY